MQRKQTSYHALHPRVAHSVAFIMITVTGDFCMLSDRLEAIIFLYEHYKFVIAAAQTSDIPQNDVLLQSAIHLSLCLRLQQ